MPTNAFTIRKLADSAGVGVEAVRYYQRRGLLAEGERTDGAFRAYGQADVQRLRFIKEAQDLGFSLDDIAELISLSAERDQRRVREITQRRVAEIHSRVARLHAMASGLQQLVERCEGADPTAACPIIAALAGGHAAPDGSKPRPRRAVVRVVDAAGAP